jgi:hypothetical protein
MNALPKRPAIEGYVDDRSGPAFPHDGEHVAGDSRQAQHVRLKHPRQLFGRRPFEWAEETVTGIVDEHVNGSESLDRCPDCRLDRGFIGHVEAQGENVIAGRPRLHGRRISRGRRDVPSASRKVLGRHPADSG